MKFTLNNTFTKELPADKEIKNRRRQVIDACYSYTSPKSTKNAKLLHVSDTLLKTLGITIEDSKSHEFLALFSGNKILEDTTPYAMCYGGHQFGNWAGQLGDGRAINLFEINHNNQQWAFQLKGAGETPYSRTADGLAVLRSSIREHLCSEAMFHLGVPTTRSLSLSLTGDTVLRDVMYNGNPAYEKGAVVCRTAPSFIRFGNFEILAANQNQNGLKAIADYTIKHFYPKITTKGKQKYLDFLTAVRDRTIQMVVEWQRVGFVHGVMNTDNMSILGLTIDYGPYGWLESYDQTWTPNTTDLQHKRYRFGNQPYICMWNLYKLANALYTLINEVEPLQGILENFEALYTIEYEKMMMQKLGIFVTTNSTLIDNLEQTLQLTETDYTIFFRLLSTISKQDTPEIAIQKVNNAFYQIEELKNHILLAWKKWFANYINILKTESLNDNSRKIEMNLVNPKYVFRNYMAQLAIDQAEKDDYTLINEFYTLLKTPYKEQPENKKWFTKRPEWARNKVGCSMLSCSS